jgi:hypothetical protein
MRKKPGFPIQKKCRKITAKFNKNIYPLNSIKTLLDDTDSIREDRNYWNVETENMSIEDIMQSYNYLLYLNRRQ